MTYHQGMVRAFTIVAVAAALGCSGASGGGATGPTESGGEPGSGGKTGDTEPPAVRPIPDGAPPEQLVMLFEYLAGDVRDAGDDCDAQALAFSRWTDAYSGDYDRLVEEAVTSDLPADRIEALNRRLAEHMDAIIDSFDTNCDDHRAARAGFDRFEALILDI